MFSLPVGAKYKFVTAVLLNSIGTAMLLSRRCPCVCNAIYHTVAVLKIKIPFGGNKTKVLVDDNGNNRNHRRVKLLLLLLLLLLLVLRQYCSLSVSSPPLSMAWNLSVYIWVCVTLTKLRLMGRNEAQTIVYSRTYPLGGGRRNTTNTICGKPRMEMVQGKSLPRKMKPLVLISEPTQPSGSWYPIIFILEGDEQWKWPANETDEFTWNSIVACAYCSTSDRSNWKGGKVSSWGLEYLKHRLDDHHCNNWLMHGWKDSHPWDERETKASMRKIIESVASFWN